MEKNGNGGEVKMIDMDKVIKGLAEIIDYFFDVYRNDTDSYKCEKAQEYSNVAIDALAILKEHGHDETFIVIDNKTGKEADTYNIALHEDWAKHLCYCDMEGWAIEEDGTLLLVDECGQFAYADRERFKVKWDG